MVAIKRVTMPLVIAIVLLQICHFRNREKFRLEPGMVFTIEPILTEGQGDIVTWSDGWTAATKDGSWYI